MTLTLDTTHTAASAEVLVKELERELYMRKQVYPGLIAKGSMTQAVANQRLAAIEQAVGVIRRFHAAVAALEAPGLPGF